ncbi:serine protease 38-like [Phymastichus coffea]|uniref:serine protease 38-like n=1 Tax=Phymastichus coffea TaxID=108790 RepID=UPI00273C7F70|nr:serine protease 38-like [Phymastichus coffea]
MNSLLKMFKYIMHLYFITITPFPFYEATPLIGPEPDVQVATIYEMLFIVSIGWNKSSNYGKEENNHLCGGSLITTQHVLTVANCFNFRQNYHEIVVRIGSNNLRLAKLHTIEWWKTYHEWLNKAIDPVNELANYDMAIVKLHNAASSDIELPTIKYMSFDNFIGRLVMTGGWGRMENDIVSRNKRVGKFFVMDPNECELFRPNRYFCSTSLNARMTKGDSGSPLLMKDEHTLIGIHKGECIMNTSTVPSHVYVHLSVNNARQFINEVTRM